MLLAYHLAVVCPANFPKALQQKQCIRFYKHNENSGSGSVMLSCALRL